MKLIIEIPKPMYESVQNGTYCGTLYTELKNGTPLDDVKEQMEERHDIHDLGKLKSRSNVGIMMFGVDAYNRGIKHAIEILDNIDKAESEDKNENNTK